MQSSPFQNPTHDELAALIESSSKKWLSAYLILDGALIGNAYFLPDLPKDREYILKGTAFDDLMLQGPLVFGLNQNHRWLSWVTEAAKPDATCLFFSKADPGAILAHLKKLSAASTDSTANSYLFRFYDPRNLCTLFQSFTEEEVQNFLGPITSLFWFTKTAYPAGAVKFKPQWYGLSNANPSVSTLKDRWPLSQTTLAALQHHLEPQIARESLSRVANYSDTRIELRRLGHAGAKSVALLAINAGVSHKMPHVNEYAQRIKNIIRFGSVFDRDPQYPWVNIAPKDETPQERWQRCHLMADEAYEDIFQENPRSFEYFITRLWLLRSRYRDLARMHSSEEISECLSRLWPERFNAFSYNGVLAMIEKAEQDAHVWQMESPRGAAVLSGLYFICGIDALVSPDRYPWLTHVGQEMIVQPPEQRASYLYGRLMQKVGWLYKKHGPSRVMFRKAARLYAHRRCLKRLSALSLEDLKRQKSATKFFARLHPEQYYSVKDARKRQCLADSISFAQVFAHKYKLADVIPIIAFWAFSLFIRSTNYSRTLSDGGYMAAFLDDYGILQMDAKDRQRAFFDGFIAMYEAHLPHPHSSMPTQDIYRDILNMSEGEYGN